MISSTQITKNHKNNGCTQLNCGTKLNCDTQLNCTEQPRCDKKNKHQSTYENKNNTNTIIVDNYTHNFCISFCNNCGRSGHLFHQCKSPIISIGIIAFRHNHNLNEREYLMIRRKNTLGFVDFIRGKYPIYDYHYLNNIISEMTCNEKNNILHNEFDDLWHDLWGDQRSTYYNEEKSSRNKFNQLRMGIQMGDKFVTLANLVHDTNKKHEWYEPEWGFPKGRRNYMEKDYTCAMREFQEETGYSKNNIRVIHNIIPYEETFIGSNLRCYKHKYYIAYIPFDHTFQMNNFQKNEVSQMKWCTFSESIGKIRHYNQEKITLLKNIEITLNNYIIVI